MPDDKIAPAPLKKPAEVAASNAAASEDVSSLPSVPESTPINELIEDQPAVVEYKGKYECKRDGLIYALAVKDDPIRGKTHHARNQKWFWEGTKDEFEKQFVKQ